MYIHIDIGGSAQGGLLALVIEGETCNVACASNCFVEATAMCVCVCMYVHTAEVGKYIICTYGYTQDTRTCLHLLGAKSIEI